LTTAHQFEEHLRGLRLFGMLETLPVRLAQASAGELVEVLCEDEATRHDAADLERRLRAAHFEQVTMIESRRHHTLALSNAVVFAPVLDPSNSPGLRRRRRSSHFSSSPRRWIRQESRLLLPIPRTFVSMLYRASPAVTYRVERFGPPNARLRGPSGSRMIPKTLPAGSNTQTPPAPVQ